MNRKFQFALVVALCGAVALVLCPVNAQATTVNWTGGGGDGLWSTPANWDSTITTGTYVAIDVDGAAVTVNSGGVVPLCLKLANVANASATLNVQPGADLGSSLWAVVGDAGNATINQTGGLVTFYQGAGVANGNGTSTYSISAGTLNDYAGFQVGVSGHGYLNVSGTANVSSPELEAGFHYVPSFAGTGVITQTGGTVTATILDLAPGANQTGTYHLSGGTLTSTTMNAGPGAATFDFSGGVLHAGTVNFDLTNNGGTLAPGSSVGTTTINGNYTQGATGKTQIEMSAPSVYDLVTLNGASRLASLDGTLQLSLLSGYTPTLGQTFDVLTASSITLGSSFALDAALASLPTGEQWGYQVVGTAGSGQSLELQVTSVPEPGALVLLAAGLMSLLAYAWRKRR